MFVFFHPKMFAYIRLTPRIFFVQGCFVFKAKKGKPLNPCDYMQPDENDTDATWFRCNTYEALWDKVGEEVEVTFSTV